MTERITPINSKDTLNVDIVFFLPFEELPQVVRDYITIRVQEYSRAM